MTANFDDGKDDSALRTIGEVSKALGIKTHILRYWEQQFPQLDPLKRSGGRRYYRPADVEMIETINRLVNDEGYTLKGALQAMETGKSDNQEPTDDHLTEPLSAKSEQAAAADTKLPLELTTPIADNGGVGEFFGRAPASPPDTPPVPAEPVIQAEESSDGAEISEAGMPHQDIVARLKQMRGRLADALAA